MKQLSGLDASFLYMETASQFGHVSSLSIYERPDDPDYEPLVVVAPPDRAAAPPARAAAPPPAQRAVRPRPPVLGRRPRLRPRLPRPPHRGGAAGRATSRSPSWWPASSAARSTAAGPLWESYVIEGLPDDRFAILTKVHHATIDGAAGRRAAHADARRRPRGRRDRAARGRLAARAAAQRRRGAHPRPPPTSSASPARAVVLATRTVRELGRATRNPVLVAAANQVRDGLRGPLGAVLNIGRERVARGRVGRAAARAARPARRSTPPSPPHRRFAFRSTSLDAGQGHQERARRHRERRGDGGLRRRAAHVARDARRPARQAARRDGAGVDPHRRGDREVDQPGVGHLRRAAHRRARPAAARGRGCTRRWSAPRSCSTPCPPTPLTDFAQFPPPAVFARAMRTATRLSTRFAAAGERGDLAIRRVGAQQGWLVGAKAGLRLLIAEARVLARKRHGRRHASGRHPRRGRSIHALDHHVDRLTDDHTHASPLWPRPGGVDPATVDTNIVVVPLLDAYYEHSSPRALRRAVTGCSGRPRPHVRMVTHLDVSARRRRAGRQGAAGLERSPEGARSASVGKR